MFWNLLQNTHCMSKYCWWLLVKGSDYIEVKRPLWNNLTKQYSRNQAIVELVMQQLPRHSVDKFQSARFRRILLLHLLVFSRQDDQEDVWFDALCSTLLYCQVRNLVTDSAQWVWVEKAKGTVVWLCLFVKGRARTQSPTSKNYAPELPTFGVIARVSPTGVQWKGLALGEPPSWSRYPLCQVSMLVKCYIRFHGWAIKRTYGGVQKVSRTMVLNWYVENREVRAVLPKNICFAYTHE